VAEAATITAMGKSRNLYWPAIINGRGDDDGRQNDCGSVACNFDDRSGYGDKDDGGGCHGTFGCLFALASVAVWFLRLVFVTSNFYSPTERPSRSSFSHLRVSKTSLLIRIAGKSCIVRSCLGPCHPEAMTDSILVSTTTMAKIF
jgi:hypothetical protein